MAVASNRFLCGIVFAGLLSSACGAADDAREPAEPIDVSEQAATAAPTLTWFRWNKGEPAKRMERVSTHVCGLAMLRGECTFCKQPSILSTAFCYLSSISGDLNGGEEWAQVFPFYERDLWHFTVNAGQATLGIGAGSVYAEVTCLDYDQTRSSIPIIR